MKPGWLFVGAAITLLPGLVMLYGISVLVGFWPIAMVAGMFMACGLGHDLRHWWANSRSPAIWELDLSQKIWPPPRAVDRGR